MKRHAQQSLDLVRLLPGEPTRAARASSPNRGQVLIEVPARQGHLIPMRPGEKIEVYFRLRDERYFFESTVRSATA